MAFSGTWKDDKLIKTGADGLVGLNWETQNYRAWRHWLIEEFGKTFFPEWITVTGEWPPTTQAGADAFAEHLSNIRDSKYQKEQSIIGGRAVPRHPKPWSGFVPPAPKPDAPLRLVTA